MTNDMTQLVSIRSVKIGGGGVGPLAPGYFSIPAPNACKLRFVGVDWRQELDHA